MNEIKIQTSQQTVIGQSAASVAERILAQLIDYCIYFAYYIFIIIFGIISKNANYTFWIAISLPVLIYHLLSEILMEGQSWGKKAMKIKVVKVDGGQPSVTDYFIRWVFRIIDVTIMFGGVAALTIILNGKGQRLGDLAANTAVIRLKEKNKLPKSIFKKLPDNYKVVYPQAENLEMKDIFTIKEVIDYYLTYENMQLASKMAIKTKTAIENKLNVKSEQTAVEFLKIVLNDYNFLHKG